MTTYADSPPPTRNRSRRVDERPEPIPPKRRDPLWAKLCTIFGAVVMVVAGATVIVPKVIASYLTGDVTEVDAIPTELAAENIDGAINVLLIGMDQRDGEEAEDRIRADSLMIMHIPATHDRAFMISLPRDAEVQIPDYPKTDFIGYRTKINAAFAAGAVTEDGHRDPSPKGRAQGAELTMLTINKLVPGGMKFNGVAIINFDGFLSVLEAIGGVHMCIDTEVWSIHYDAAGNRSWYDLPDGVGYHYVPTCRDMQAWEALDYARQRHLPDGDYGRQRHQQQLIKAIIAKVASTDTLANFGKINDLKKAAGDLLTIDLLGTKIEDWVYTLSSLRSDDIVMIKTNGGKFAASPNDPTNETFTPESIQLLQAVQNDKVFDFLTTHQDWIATDA
jgi:anionic cell wall polymer biosynthesis LytR-Cps2A-Psr (LCP) family protein